MNVTYDAALGAVIGALTGDAAGAVLEFFGRPITPDDVAHAMTMPGGGAWCVAPGQVTDDGELTMSLLRALAEEHERPTEAAARRYARWVATDPFDIGATTAASLGCLVDPDRAARAAADPIGGAARVMAETARERCMRSKANGSAMRATPLAVWGAGRSLEETAAAAARDAALSHPNTACVASTTAYVVALRHLLLERGDVAGAFAAAERAAGDEPEVRGWLADAREGVLVPYSPMDGFVRIAFTHAFRHLLAGTPWEDAIRETLLGGGDTDTNACVVGGLLGARWGVDAIPPAMREVVLGSEHARGQSPRPPELHPRDAPRLVRRVLDGRADAER